MVACSIYSSVQSLQRFISARSENQLWSVFVPFLFCTGSHIIYQKSCESQRVQQSPWRLQNFFSNTWHWPELLCNTTAMCAQIVALLPINLGLMERNSVYYDNDYLRHYTCDTGPLQRCYGRNTSPPLLATRVSQDDAHGWELEEAYRDRCAPCRWPFHFSGPLCSHTWYPVKFLHHVGHNKPFMFWTPLVCCACS